MQFLEYRIGQRLKSGRLGANGGQGIERFEDTAPFPVFRCVHCHECVRVRLSQHQLSGRLTDGEVEPGGVQAGCLEVVKKRDRPGPTRLHEMRTALGAQLLVYGMRV